MMIEYWDFYFGYEAPTGGQGMATTLPEHLERDPAADVRAVVAEVTGRPCEQAPPRRIGFEAW